MLREIGFDAALCSNPLHYLQDLKLALELGIPSRAGYTYKGLSGWVTHPITIQYPQPFPDYFRDFVAQLTGEEPTWASRPVVQTTREDAEKAEALWKKLPREEGKPVIACFMTSRQSRGVWPAEAFARTLQILASRNAATLLLCGATSDRPLLARINHDYALHATIHAGELGLRALVCFLKHLSVVITTDSGPRHLANAAGVPVVFIRNLAFKKSEAGSYCETEYDMASDAESISLRKQDRFLRQTTPESVAAKVLELLQQERRETHS
jgi:ADP-heptose:LPS heptosyltransferase